MKLSHDGMMKNLINKDLDIVTLSVIVVILVDCFKLNLYILVFLTIFFFYILVFLSLNMFG
jgi:hypothetical protein